MIWLVVILYLLGIAVIFKCCEASARIELNDTQKKTLREAFQSDTDSTTAEPPQDIQ